MNTEVFIFHIVVFSNNAVKEQEGGKLIRFERFTVIVKFIQSKRQFNLAMQ